jgi:hypothetical protein
MLDVKNGDSLLLMRHFDDMSAQYCPQSSGVFAVFFADAGCPYQSRPTTEPGQKQLISIGEIFSTCKDPNTFSIELL